jgi:hypothetical protein
MNPTQATIGNPPVDRGGADSKRGELPEGNHPVLSTCEPVDERVKHTHVSAPGMGVFEFLPA